MALGDIRSDNNATTCTNTEEIYRNEGLRIGWAARSLRIWLLELGADPAGSSVPLGPGDENDERRRCDPHRSPVSAPVSRRWEIKDERPRSLPELRPSPQPRPASRVREVRFCLFERSRPEEADAQGVCGGVCLWECVCLSSSFVQQ